MPNEPPEDELSKQLSVLTDTIGKLTDRLEEKVLEPPSQGAPQQHPPPGSITSGKIWGFVAGNLTILAAITVFLWTSLSNVAEKIAKDTATQTAQTSTARYLQDDPRKRSDELLEKTLAIRRSLYREKLAKVLNFAVERASENVYNGFLKQFIKSYKAVPRPGDENEFQADGALATALRRDSESKTSPYALTHELIRKVDLGDQKNWKLLENLLPALDPHLQDAKVGEFVLDVAQSLTPESGNRGAILAAVQVLGNLKDQDMLPRATKALLKWLQPFAGAAEERASVDPDKREKLLSGRRELADAVMDTLSRYVRVTQDADTIMDAIMRQLPAEENIGFKFAELKASERLGQRFHKRGRKAADASEWQRAIENYSAAIRLSPDNAKYYVYRGYARLGSESELDQILSDASEAIALKKDYALAHKLRASVYIMRGDESSTTKAIKEAMALYSTPSQKAGAFENLGLLFIGNEDWQRALEHTKEVNDLYDKKSWNWLIRAIAAHNLGQIDLAQEAHAKWTALKGNTDLAELKKYIGQQLDAYLSNRSKLSD